MVVAGAGSIGSLLAAHLAQVADVTVLTRREQHAAALREQGIFVPAIRYPTVARGQARLRLTVTAIHTAEDISLLVAALRSVRNLQSAIANE